MSEWQMAALGLVGAIWAWFLVGEYWPKVSGALSGIFGGGKVKASAAFDAASLLVRYYQEQGCEEGHKAAIEAGRHILDCHK